MSDTPETDEELAYRSFGFYTMGGLPTEAIKPSFARELERQRDAYEYALQAIYLITVDGEDIWSDLEEISVISHNAINYHEHNTRNRPHLCDQTQPASNIPNGGNAENGDENHRHEGTDGTA